MTHFPNTQYSLPNTPRPPFRVPCRVFRVSSGFTLVEVLASLAILALVLPAVMYGLSLSSSAASIAKHRTQATTLAQTKLDELQVLYFSSSGQLGLLSGDFSQSGHPEYKWSAAINPWSPPDSADASLSTSLLQLDVTVSWTDRNQPYQASLSTLLYEGANTSLGTTPLPGGALP